MQKKLNEPSTFKIFDKDIDNETEIIVLIGEIGGQLEADAAKWYLNSKSNKPIVGFIAGETAPSGRTMGHAGAIVGGADDTAVAKKRILKESGIHVVDSPAEIGKKVMDTLRDLDKIAYVRFASVYTNFKEVG